MYNLLIMARFSESMQYFGQDILTFCTSAIFYRLKNGKSFSSDIEECYIKEYHKRTMYVNKGILMKICSILASWKKSRS